MPNAAALFDQFRASLDVKDIVSVLKDGLIGADAVVEGPFGPRPMIYADYVASGRALRQIEDFVLTSLLPFYANSHTQASHVGATMTLLRQEARRIVAEACHATDEHAVIFAGNGATQGINRLVHLFGVPELVRSKARPLVIIGPYEHHSNILPWRESGAEVIMVGEACGGGPDLGTLDRILDANAGRPIIGAMSAASNITGIVSDVVAITKRLKRAGAIAVWDYAGGGPYLDIDMTPDPAAPIDAIVISTHKFVGGPQASGILVVRKDAVNETRPSITGGGTVRFVSPDEHHYSASLEVREEAGTPNVIGDLRAALCFLVKSAIGQELINERNLRSQQIAAQKWALHPNIEVLGNSACKCLPIFSFRIRDQAGGYVHQQLITRLLSDRYGIQARGGCACAGPYVHQLLAIDRAASEDMLAAILAGNEIEKPGFVRLNFGYLASDEEVDTIIAAVAELAETAVELAELYQVDRSTAIFSPISPTGVSPTEMAS